MAIPTSVDVASQAARTDELQRQRRAYGRQQTILAGGTPQGSVMPTAPVKTALGM